MVETALSIFLDENIFSIMIVGGVVVGFVFLYRMLRKVPTQPDYVGVFHDLNIRDEQMNKPTKIDPKMLWRGTEPLGKIISYDTQTYNYNPTKEEKEKGMYDKFLKEITTIVYRPKTFWKFYFGEKRIVLLEKGEGVIQEHRFVIPSSVGLTAIGKTYVTKGSFTETARIVDGTFSKRLYESNVNVMASRMSHIAQETPEMAHELNLARLKIEQIRAEKETKMGGLI